MTHQPTPGTSAVPEDKKGRTLPPRAAFVLQLQSDVDLTAGTVAGRVEHVTSGAAVRFGSLGELLAFIAEALAASQVDPRSRNDP